MTRLAERAVGWVALAAAGYTAVQVLRYFLPPQIPRYQVESAYFVLVALGVLAIALRGATAAGRLGSWFHYESDEGPAWWHRMPAIAAVFLAAGFALYAPILGIGFLSDDYVIADWASRLELVHVSETGFLRPGVPLFWAMLGVLPGELATAAHAANIALHGLNAVLVTIVALRFEMPRREAVTAGAIFVLSAGLSEAIVWASGVQDVLMTTLVLAAVALATVRRDPKIVAAIIATVCAVLVKETAVVTPLLVVLVLVARSGGRLDRSEWTTVGALLAVVGGYLIVRLILGVPSTFFAVDDWRYLIKQLVAGAFATLGAPWTDTWWRTHLPLALLRALTIVALLAAGIYRWGRRDPRFRQAIAAALWVLAGIAPVFSLYFVGPNLEGARYVYLSTAGFSLLLAVFAGTAAELIVRPERHRRFALTAIAALVAGSAAPATLSDLERWQRAASTRDAVLGVVRRELGRLNCTTFTLEGTADSSEGAYVLRNGLREAVGVRDGTPAVSCRVAGSEGQVTVVRE